MVALLIGSVGLVAYVFVGYPAALGLLSRVAARPIASAHDFTPQVSLVVLAFDEEEYIEDKLRNIAELDYPTGRLDVLVVADGSTDRTVQRASRFPGVRVLHQPQRRGKLAAINRGVDAAGSDVIVLSDANNLYVRGALRALVAPLADPAVGMVTGAKRIDDGSGRALDQAEGMYWRYESKLKEWESATGSVVGVCGEILAFRREGYRSPPPGSITEDSVQAMLAAIDGWRIAYAPAAVSVERASATVADEATRRSRMTVGRMQLLRDVLPTLMRTDRRLAWQVISHKGARPLVPWALAVAACSNCALARRPGWPRAAGIAQLLFYSAAALGWHDDRVGRGRRWTYMPFYFCHMNVASLAGMRDYLVGRKDPAWVKVRRGEAPVRAPAAGP